MGKRKIGALEKVEANLYHNLDVIGSGVTNTSISPNLQYKIRQDPLSYQSDFHTQFEQYKAQREIFVRDPAGATESGVISFRDLVEFVAHVADCYPEATANVSEELAEILTTHQEDLESELREKIIGSLVLLRKKKIVDSLKLLQTFFPILIRTPSKSLRKVLYQRILMELRTSNAKNINHSLNRTTQSMLHNLITSDSASAKGIWAVKLTRELWKRQTWSDAKAVGIIKEACLADNVKVVTGAVTFFLGGDKEREELQDESSDDDAPDMGKLRHQMGVNKKTKHKARAVENAIASVKKKERRRKQPHPLNFSAFHLLQDPQGFTEDLFSKHLQNQHSKLNLEQRLLVLQLISRLVGLHKLIILPLYSYFLKYLNPRQPSVTSFLASLAQSIHAMIPPEDLEPLIQKVANEFVSEAAAAEVASAGLNGIREICIRQPLAMNQTLLQDLVMYKKSKDKGVMMAAKGLLGLYREVGVDMLKKRDRGKKASMGLGNGEQKIYRFGEEAIGQIEGLELLEKWKVEEKRKKGLKLGINGEVNTNEEESATEDDDGGWEIEEVGTDDSGGWINVDSDNAISISDSDDGRPSPKRAKLTSPAGIVEPMNKGDDKENKREKAVDADEVTSTLASTTILTPADLSKLRELQLEANIGQHLPPSHRKRIAQQQAQMQRHADDPLTAVEIEGLASFSKKASKADKVALARDGKLERSAHQSTRAKRKEKKDRAGKSSTNKEKARKKNFMMTLGKAKGKQKRSLVEKGRVLKAHVERNKRGGKRGNG